MLIVSPYPFFILPFPSSPFLSSTQLDVCRRNCLIYTVFKALLNQILTEGQCQAICAANVRLNLRIYLYTSYHINKCVV